MKLDGSKEEDELKKRAKKTMKAENDATDTTLSFRGFSSLGDWIFCLSHDKFIDINN